VSAILSEDQLLQIVASLAADEVGKLRQREVPPSESCAWTSATEVGEGGPGSLGLDSLGRIDVATRVNQFFHLHEVGIEDYLLIERTLGGWSRIVAEALKLGAARVSFRTSGSTGDPKTCTQDLADILREVDELADALDRPKRVIGLVPPHHIYGFIFTALLPARLRAPLLDARALAPGQLRQALAAGDMIVATPHLWRYLQGSLGGFPTGVSGVSSTAPMPADLARSLTGSGLAWLAEIYGSSETSGIGWRRSPDDPFRLFSFWDVSPDGQALRRGADRGWIALPDRVEPAGDRMIRPAGRRDGAVQVGGINVFPAKVRDAMTRCPGVKDAAVRDFAVDGDAARRRLKAFVVPADENADTAGLEAELRAFAADNLTPQERPSAYAFGPALPLNAIGKLTDWS
jgi:4-coumarate--CoA ligase (photoactive yellow protein activation family)